MKKNKSTKTHGFIAVVVVLALLCGVLAVGVVSTASTMASYSTSLENVYKRSYYELSNNINDIEVALSKTLVSNDTKSQAADMESIYENCTMAVNNISHLPLNSEALNQTTKFLNQMGGFSYSLNQSLKNGKALTTEQITELNELYNTCVLIQNKLTEFDSNNVNYNILKTSKLEKENSFGSLFQGFKQQGTEYPTLIYDGPFSDSTINKEVKGLSGENISIEQAKEKIISWFKGATEVSLSNENKGKFETYNFTFTDLKNRKCFAQVSKIGGLLLNFDSYCLTKQDNFKLSDLEIKAEEFASLMGLNLKAVWSTKINGVAYINLTTMLDGVVVYPEMVKVKICADSGDIVGWEAQSYAYNHTSRKIEKTKITQSEALNKVSSELNVVSQRLCIIPLENNKEVLAYEFTATKNNFTYYVYIDAQTGEQVKIMRVVSTVSGDMVI